MKIGRTDTPGFDCFIILTEKFLQKEEKEEIGRKIFDKYGPITIYFANTVEDGDDLWTTNRHGLDHDRHDEYQNVDFEFVMFKEPSFYL